MYQRDQLKSKLLLWWQEKQPQGNPLFTAYSSSNCVWVDWLYIIQTPHMLQYSVLESHRLKPQFEFLNGRAAFLWPLSLMVVMFAEARYQTNIQYTPMLNSSMGQILMMQDGTQSNWSCSVPRVAFEGCVWKAIMSQPCCEGCSLSENRATPKKLSPIPRIHQVCLCFLQLS